MPEGEHSRLAVWAASTSLLTATELMEEALAIGWLHLAVRLTD